MYRWFILLVINRIMNGNRVALLFTLICRKCPIVIYKNWKILFFVIIPIFSNPHFIIDLFSRKIRHNFLQTRFSHNQLHCIFRKKCHFHYTIQQRTVVWFLHIMYKILLVVPVGALISSFSAYVIQNVSLEKDIFQNVKAVCWKNEKNMPSSFYVYCYLCW